MELEQIYHRATKFTPPLSFRTHILCKWRFDTLGVFLLLLVRIPKHSLSIQVFLFCESRCSNRPEKGNKNSNFKTKLRRKSPSFPEVSASGINFWLPISWGLILLTLMVAFGTDLVGGDSTWLNFCLSCPPDLLPGKPSQARRVSIPQDRKQKFES